MFGVARDANKNKHIYFIKQLAERKLVFVGGPKEADLSICSHTTLDVIFKTHYCLLPNSMRY